MKAQPLMALPDNLLAVLHTKAICFVTTLMPDGSPQISQKYPGRPYPGFGGNPEQRVILTVKVEKCIHLDPSHALRNPRRRQPSPGALGAELAKITLSANAGPATGPPYSPPSVTPRSGATASTGPPTSPKPPEKPATASTTSSPP